MTTIAQLNEKLCALVKTGTDVTRDYCQIFPQMSVDDIADEDKRMFVTLCPMEYAAKTGDHDLIGRLAIMNVCNPRNEYDESLSKGLISASRARKTETVKELLRFRAIPDDIVEVDGVEVDGVEVDGVERKLSITPFDFACNYKDYDTVWELIDKRGFTDGGLLHAVIAADNHRVIDLLFNPQAHGIEMCEDLIKSHNNMLDNSPSAMILPICHETNLKAVQDHYTN